MSAIKDKIDNIIKEKNISYYQLSKMVDFDESALNKMLKGKITLSYNLLEKIAPILEVSQEEIKGWILVDKYPENILKRALEVKQEIKSEMGKLILTDKIDTLLQDKGLSRTALSGLIGYSQGKLNQMIKGDEPISPLVISKIAPVLEVSEEEIISWTVADKWSVEALQLALKSCN
jgi:transcriptional regulator with XRE-family HTH domain